MKVLPDSITGLGDAQIAAPTDDSARPSRRLRLAAGMLTVFALALPIYAIWSRTYVPMSDLPNHMTRHYLEYLKLSGRGLPSYYEVDYRLIPNLGGDLIAPLFFFFFAPLTACKAFVTACVFLYWLGPTMFIRQQCGRWRGALVAALFWLPWLLSSEFFWGFTTYYSGFGLAFLVLTHSRALRGASGRSALVAHVVLHTALVTLLFLWHLSPWAIYCVFAGSQLLACSVDDYLRFRTIKRCLTRALPLALPFIPSMFLLASYALSLQATGQPIPIRFSGWSQKLRFAQALFGDYDARCSAIALLIWGIAVLSTFRFSFAFDKRFRWTSLHLALAVLTLAYLLLPNDVVSVGADTRLLPGILVGVLAALGELPVRRLALCMLLLASNVAVRDGAVIGAWDRLSARLDSHARTFALIEPGSRVMPVTITPIDYTFPDDQFISWAAVLRDAFVPTLYARRDSHVLRLVSPCGIYVKTAAAGYEFEEGPIRDCYDYVWLYNPEQKAVRIPTGWRRLFSEDSLTLWRVDGTGGEHRNPPRP